jgi:hypothetical protein
MGFFVYGECHFSGKFFLTRTSPDPLLVFFWDIFILDTMKTDIKESQLDNLIINFFDEDYYPDYGWEDASFYEKELESYDDYNFYINDNLAYTYFHDGSMEINKWLIDDLNSRFGDRWIPLFKRWFEMNTGLTVYDMITENVISESVDKDTKKINLLYSLIKELLEKYSWFESFEIVEEQFQLKEEVIPTYIFVVKDKNDYWGYDNDELNEEIDFIFSMLFPYEDGNPIAVWDIKFI